MTTGNTVKDLSWIKEMPKSNKRESSPLEVRIYDFIDLCFCEKLHSHMSYYFGLKNYRLMLVDMILHMKETKKKSKGKERNWTCHQKMFLNKKVFYIIYKNATGSVNLYLIC